MDNQTTSATAKASNSATIADGSVNDSVRNDGSSALTSLPSDVFIALTSGFDLAAINTLRQVSHSLNAAATNELFTEYFAHRTTDLTTKSLNDLIGVCSSEFGSYVKSITIRASFWRLDRLETQLKDKAKWEPKGPNNGPIFASQQRPLTEDELVLVEENLDIFKALNADQRALQVDGKAAALLARAMQALGDRSVCIKLEAAQYRDTLDQWLPARRLFGEPANLMQKVMDDAFKTTITAIARSNIQVEKFEVFDADHAGHVSLDGMYDSFVSLSTDESTPSDSPSSPSIPHGLSRLQSLSLAISPPPDAKIPVANSEESNGSDEQKPAAENDTEAQPSRLTTLQALLTVCSSTLQSLDIRLRGLTSKHHTTSTILLNNLPLLPNLSTLHLRGFVIAPASLISLLTPATYLTTLGLHRISLSSSISTPTPTVSEKAEHEAWLPIFAHLATLPILTTFETNALYLSNFAKMIFPSSPRSALSRIPKNDYTTRIYFEGCPCITFTGSEIRAETATPDAEVFERERKDTVMPRSWDDCRWGAPTGEDEGGALVWGEVGNGGKDGEREQGKEGLWTPIRYRIGKRRPLGSPYLYRWIQVGKWEYGLF